VGYEGPKFSTMAKKPYFTLLDNRASLRSCFIYIGTCFSVVVSSFTNYNHHTFFHWRFVVLSLSSFINYKHWRVVGVWCILEYRVLHEIESIGMLFESGFHLFLCYLSLIFGGCGVLCVQCIIVFVGNDFMGECECGFPFVLVSASVVRVECLYLVHSVVQCTNK